MHAHVNENQTGRSMRDIFVLFCVTGYITSQSAIIYDYSLYQCERHRNTIIHPHPHNSETDTIPPRQMLLGPG